MSLASFGLSMTVHATVTGLIVFRILQVFLGNKPTSVERTLGSTGGTTLQHIIFVIIESGMMLFAIQLVRIVLGNVRSVPNSYLNFVVGINEMLNVIIYNLFISFCFVLLITFTWLGYRTNINFGARFNEIVLRRRGILQGSCRKSSL